MRLNCDHEKSDLEMFIDLHVSGSSEYDYVVSEMLPACMYICIYIFMYVWMCAFIISEQLGISDSYLIF
jgi:hypothetical protein